MKNRFIPILLGILLMAGIPSALWSITIKLASPIPENTEWHNGLLKMADEWRTISDGKIRLRIYPGTIAGSEGDMVRKMRIGQLDAGIFSAFGMKFMVPETFVVTLPGLIKNDRELGYVMNNWIGRFDQRFREEGFELMAWTKAGWAYLFGDMPLVVPEVLQKQVLAIDNTETEIAAAFKSLGFNVATVSLTEIMVALQSGYANSLYAPPSAAAAFQWFALAPYMTEYRLAPVVGGIVLSERTWSRIPVQYREPMKNAAAKMAKQFQVDSLDLNKKALRIMEKNGLIRVPINKQEIELWDRKMLDGHSLIVGDGKSIPLDVYNDLLGQLDELRENAGE
ncbi:MAG: hypothetical protein B6D68_01825 [spirochete symbiont of Stewartia floridana]|nr:MAG: hypothetical protein B6D68_01825 [spirochete symbiont of Stewartia floridana]